MFRAIYYLTVLVTTLGGSTQFYSYNVVNPAQEILTAWLNATFTQRNNGLPPTASHLNIFWSMVVSSIAIGAIFGSLLMRTLAEQLGRKNALIANGMTNVVGAAIQYGARQWASPEFLIVGRLILGANLGLSSGLVPMYLMEISPMRYRGMIATIHQIAVAFSDCISLLMGLPEVLGGTENWQFAFSFPGLPALLLCLILPFCPESPKYTLITKNQREKAAIDIQRLVKSTEARKMYETLLYEATFAEKSSGSYRELFTRSDLRSPLLLAVWMMVSQQFTGCAAVFAYSTDMFISAQVTPTVARYCTLSLGIVYFFFACSAAFLIERVGRRALSLFQLGVVTAALFSISIVTLVQKYITSVWTSYAAVATMILYMSAYGVGSPIPWMITGEIFPTKFRSAAITVAIFVSWFILFFVSLVYLPFKQLVGVSASYLPFIIVSAFSTFVIYWFLPETTNKHSEEIVREIVHRSRSFSVRRRSFNFFDRRASASGGFARCSEVNGKVAVASTENEYTPLLLTDAQLENYCYLSLSKLYDNALPPPASAATKALRVYNDSKIAVF